MRVNTRVIISGFKSFLLPPDNIIINFKARARARERVLVRSPRFIPAITSSTPVPHFRWKNQLSRAGHFIITSSRLSYRSGRVRPCYLAFSFSSYRNYRSRALYRSIEVVSPPCKRAAGYRDWTREKESHFRSDRSTTDQKVSTFFFLFLSRFSSPSLFLLYTLYLPLSLSLSFRSKTWCQNASRVIRSERAFRIIGETDCCSRSSGRRDFADSRDSIRRNKPRFRRKIRHPVADRRRPCRPPVRLAVATDRSPDRYQADDNWSYRTRSSFEPKA